MSTIAQKQDELGQDINAVISQRMTDLETTNYSLRDATIQEFKDEIRSLEDKIKSM